MSIIGSLSNIYVIDQIVRFRKWNGLETSFPSIALRQSWFLCAWICFLLKSLLAYLLKDGKSIIVLRKSEVLKTCT